METRIALLAVLVKNQDSVEKLNALLHEYRAYIVGRMGIPYKQKQVAIISIAIDATQDIISALSGKIGALEGVSSKTVFA
ncbi:MAG: TM1266 family iron-only hydrogenase system putative regulator [Alphaproteobacteria bacterium]|nr:TM1266 family iron-only hydrogenase system putative regulator [Alphaproteobacteria bacterium]